MPAIDDSRFWELVGLLGGLTDEPDWGSFRAGLLTLTRAQMRSFAKQYRAACRTLAGLELVEESGYKPIGDDALALRSAVIAAGPQEYERVVTATGPVATAAINPVGMDLDELVKSLYEEVTGEMWPGFDWVGLTKVSGRRVSAQVAVAHRSTPLFDAVDGALEKLESSTVYGDAAKRLGFTHVWYSGHIYSPGGLGEKPGTNWRIRKSDEALWIDFQIDRADFPGSTPAEGEAFVRKVVDEVAKKKGLPSSMEVFGPQA